MFRCCSKGSNAGVYTAIFGGAVIAILSSSNHGGQAAKTQPGAPPEARLPGEAKDPNYVLDHTMPRIDGTPQDLNAYEGKVVLMVNTASKCGLTPQYEGLEALYRKHKDKGLVILGFPANDFGNQEPGSNGEILEFCTSRFEVSFPMFEKIVVTGKDAHPLYKQLRGFELEEVGGKPGQLGGDPAWNFTKFLINRSGQIDSRYSPRVTPDDKRLTDRVGELLASEG